MDNTGRSAWWRRVTRLIRVREPEAEPEPLTASTLSAQQGAVVVGVQQDGSQIVINNLGIPDAVVNEFARGAPLLADKAKAVAGDFLRYIEKYYRYLPLKGMGDNSGLRLRFPLVELFVPLSARLTLPVGADTLSAELRIAGRMLSDEEQQHIGGRLDEPRAVLELVREHPVLVILGDPGSGKSTLLKFLALALATGQGGSLGLDDLLPLLLPLASYSEQLDKCPALSLRQFAVDYFRDFLEVADLDRLMEGKLDEGRVLILLDGLDEVKEIGQRNVVVERVQAFLCRYVEKGNRCVMSSRIIGYQEARPPAIEGLRECTLLDFGEDEIRRFIVHWTGIVERQARDEGTVAHHEAQRESTDLFDALAVHPAVLRLAANPLLLTMLVIQKRQGVALPRHRVKLYEQYIDSLLRDWLLARPLQGAPRDLPNDALLRKTLVPLAWWMQESEPGKGLVNEADMMQWLKGHFSYKEDPEQAALAFVKDVREHSGLLIDRGGHRFGFLHLTFMEYLAGVALADRLQQTDGHGETAIVQAIVAHADQGEWRETILLAIGYLGLKQHWDEAATSLLMRLLDEPARAVGSHHVIVAQALVDMGEEGVSPQGWHSLRRRLVDEGLRSDVIPAGGRVEIGRYLAEAGDPRTEVTEVDRMQFCLVPPGAFFLGSTDADPNASDSEKAGAGQHQLDDAYWLARFPVTVAQFRQFGTETAYQPQDERCLSGLDNAPVAYVSWHDANAFCRWLNDRWQARGWVPAGYGVTLPSEPEWEKAARGGERIPTPGNQCVVAIEEIGQRGQNGSTNAVGQFVDNPMQQRRYPWGDEPDVDNANFGMAIGGVSTVGAYPGGASPYGCEELSGNVFEWTRSHFAPYPYPEDAEGRRAREGEGAGRRVLRGGAFRNIRGSARCASRSRSGPVGRVISLGFRVVLSPLR